MSKVPFWALHGGLNVVFRGTVPASERECVHIVTDADSSTECNKGNEKCLGQRRRPVQSNCCLEATVRPSLGTAEHQHFMSVLTSTVAFLILLANEVRLNRPSLLLLVEVQDLSALLEDMCGTVVTETVLRHESRCKNHPIHYKKWARDG